MYWELVKRFRTPLVFCLNRQYPVGKASEFAKHVREMEYRPHEPDRYDCEYRADKMVCDAKEKGLFYVGRVYGLLDGGRHVWNFGRTDAGVVEADTNDIKPTGKRIAFIVVI